MNEKKTSKLLKVHLGCGKNALDGFLNFDNNLFLFFKFIPFIENFLSFFKFIPKWFCEFITISREKNIKYCDASKKIPFKDSTVDLIYTCHMLEHLDQNETKIAFLNSFQNGFVNSLQYQEKYKYYGTIDSFKNIIFQKETKMIF